MPYLKVFLLSLVGFVTPVLLVIFIAPWVFDSADEKVDRRYRLAYPSHDEPSAESAEHFDFSTSAAYVPSDDSLDPLKDEVFLVSFKLRLEQLPDLGKRQRLIAKYESNASPYPGWAIGVQRRASSIRPEVYWRSANGKGGWHSFDQFPLKTKTWYSFSLVAKPGEYMSFYVEPLEKDAENTVSFLGGFGLEEIDIPATESNLLFGIRSSSAGIGSGEMKDLLLGRLKQIPGDVQGVRTFLSGGSPAIAAQLKNGEVNLWIDENGVDQSRFAHLVKPVGNGS